MKKALHVFCILSLTITMNVIAVEMPQQGQVVGMKFPNTQSSSAVINNSIQVFNGYSGQGELFFSLNNVTNADIYVNEHKLNIDDYLGQTKTVFSINIGKYTRNGFNILQVFKVTPDEGIIEVTIPYPVLQKGTPEEVGIDSKIFTVIDQLLESEISAKGIPGGQLLVAKDGKIIKDSVYGVVKLYDEQGLVANPQQVTYDTLYDLASNTKMYATNYAIQKLVYEKKLDIDVAIDDIIKNFSEYDQQKKLLTVRNLLTHTGGFIPDPQYHNPHYLHLVKIDGKEVNLLDKNNDGKNDVFTQNPSEILEMIKQTPLEFTPGTKNLYSDVDYMLLGIIVEHLSGKTLEEYCSKNFYDVLGLQHTVFNPLKKGFDKETIAATEIYGNTREGNIDFPNIRTKVVQGEVHDEKAFYGLGGVAGHAGLFSTSHDLAILMQIMLNGGGYGNHTFFNQHIIDYFNSPSITSPTYALGWRRQGNAQYAWSFGKPAADNTIGHTGWTGTSTSINFDNNLIIIWLTNTKNTPIADTQKSLHRMEGDAFQFDAAGTIASLIYQGEIGISEEFLDIMLSEMMHNRITLLNENIKQDKNCSLADYNATKSIAQVLIDRKKAQLKAYEKRILDALPKLAE